MIPTRCICFVIGFAKLFEGYFLPRNFYEAQWLSNMALATEFPDCKFYESYEEMLEQAGLDDNELHEIGGEFMPKNRQKEAVRL